MEMKRVHSKGEYFQVSDFFGRWRGEIRGGNGICLNGISNSIFWFLSK